VWGVTEIISMAYLKMNKLTGVLHYIKDNDYEKNY
jgi:hypothetical protein